MKTETKNIYQKLFDAKKEIGTLTKDAKNPFFKSSYLSLNGLLEAVEDVLVKHDLLLLQPIQNNKVCTIIYDTSDAALVESHIELGNITDPQKLGSAITYYRRYTLQSLLGLQAEDDDGNTASQPIKTKDHSKNELPWLNVDMKEYKGALAKGTPIETLRKYFRISKANAAVYEAALKLNA